MADRFPEITSVEEFIRLRESEDPAEYNRSAWATMPLPVWWDLVRNHPDMRFWAAHNRTVPSEILTELIKDPDWRVRDRVASKRRCPPELLEQLVDDPNDAVRRLVAGHPHSSRSAVARLVDDPWPVIAQEARARLANWPSVQPPEPSHTPNPGAQPSRGKRCQASSEATASSINRDKTVL